MLNFQVNSCRICSLCLKKTFTLFFVAEVLLSQCPALEYDKVGSYNRSDHSLVSVFL